MKLSGIAGFRLYREDGFHCGAIKRDT